MILKRPYCLFLCLSFCFSLMLFDKTYCMEIPARTWDDICKCSIDSIVHIFVSCKYPSTREPFRSPSRDTRAGTGFLINPKETEGKCYILTNYHVIEAFESCQVQFASFSSEKLPADVIGCCPQKDLALLQLKESAHKDLKKKGAIFMPPPLSFGDSDAICEGHPIMVMGYPLTSENCKFSLGSCSGRQSCSTGECIQTDAAINAGNSGGPAFNNRGDVVGVAFLKATGSTVDGIAFLIPMADVLILT